MTIAPNGGLSVNVLAQQAESRPTADQIGRGGRVQRPEAVEEKAGSGDGHGGGTPSIDLVPAVRRADLERCVGE